MAIQRIQWKRGTAAQWTANNQVLAAGEVGYETNTGKVKVGNGVDAWTVRPYATFGISGGSGVTESFETVSKNLPADDATLSYSGGNLVSVAYTSGITKTLNYTLGNLTSIVLSGSTPGGISLTKTLSYTGSDLTGIVYT